jgi:ABC-type sugar transport system ATPase subunit/ribose/xylose/arabinose/galactoside ABC-type transport system permease subunit
VRALLGENGAGKSTLVKIISGALRSDAGEVRLDGEPVTFRDPLEALRTGVGVVYQELTLLDNLTISENIALGFELVSGIGLLDWKRMDEAAEKGLATVGLEHRPGESIDLLTMAEQHLLEIARTISRHLRVLILDEPTSALGPRESAALFRLIRHLQDNGLAILYISHRLEEILGICDTVTILKDGVVVLDRPVKGLTERTIISHMIGRDLSGAPIRPKTPKEAESGIFVAEELSGPHFSGVSVSIGKGEILGLTGLIGSGALEFLETLAGMRAATGGTVTLQGKTVRFAAPIDAVRAGVLFVPEDRKSAGLALSRSARENISIGVLGGISTAGIISPARERQVVEAAAREASLAPSLLERECRQLSGGQQQKVMIARCLAARPEVLLLAEPTRGVDVGAREEIHAIIRRLAAEGMTIVVVSSDTLEMVDICTRVLIFDKGAAVAEISGAKISRESLISPPGRVVAGRGHVPGSARARRPRLLDNLGDAAVPLIALAATFAFLSATARHFLTLSNIDALAHQLVMLGLASIGQMAVIVTGGIDLSIGAVVSFSNMLSAYLLLHTNIPTAVAATLAAGAVIGFANATLVQFRFPAFLSTYAVSLILVGLSLAIFGQSVGPVPATFWVISTASIGPVPVATLVVFLLFATAYVVARRTALGKHLFAFGRDKEAARLNGVRPYPTLLVAYLTSGMAAAMAGLFLSARVGAGLPRSGLGVELDAIAAVVLGGASLFGGYISVVGTAAGVLVLTLIANGFNLLQVDPFYSGMLRGAIMLVVVGLWAARRRTVARTSGRQ